jgi:antigen flippase
MRNIIAAILKTGTGSIASLLFSIASMKILAVYLGPSGVGLFSLVKQTMLTFSSLGFGGQTAIVQGVASKEGREREEYIKTTFWIYLLGATLSVVIIELFPVQIAFYLLGKDDAQTINMIRWIGLPSALLNLYVFLKSLINGFRTIGKLAILEASGPLMILFLIYPLCIFWGGGSPSSFVWLFSISQLIMIVIALKICLGNNWLSPIFSKRYIKINYTAYLYFIKFAAVTIFTALLGTSSILLVRVMVVKHGGLYDAGLFDLAWTLSGSYVMIILSAFGTYYMPVLSNSIMLSDRQHLIRSVIRLSILMMTPMIIMAIALKPLLVEILYTSKFLPALEIVRWMLIADYLKITSWIFAITILASHNMKRHYFCAEVFWNLGFVLLSALSIFEYEQLQGIGVGIIGLYLCTNGYYLHHIMKKYEMHLSLNLIGPWLLGLTIVIVVSWFSWVDQKVKWGMLPVWLIVSLAYISIALEKSEKEKILSFFARGYLRK